jgi:hypothetical protein
MNRRSLSSIGNFGFYNHMFWVMLQQLTICSLSVHFGLHLQQCEQLSLLLQNSCFHSFTESIRIRCSSVIVVVRLRNGQERNRDSISSKNEASRLVFGSHRPSYLITTAFPFPRIKLPTFKNGYVTPFIAKDMNAWSYNSSCGAVPNCDSTRTNWLLPLLYQIALSCDITFQQAYHRNEPCSFYLLSILFLPAR